MVASKTWPIAPALYYNILQIGTVTILLTWPQYRSSQDILSAGQWSDRGCNRNENLSNIYVTVCECNHLTHFAILLNATPPENSQPVTLSLQIIGYVGVSISLVAKALTIIAFLALKYASYPYSGCIIGLAGVLYTGHYVTCVTSFTSTSESTSV